MTEGVFTRMLLDDAALNGVAAVLFDEFHERRLTPMSASRSRSTRSMACATS